MTSTDVQQQLADIPDEHVAAVLQELLKALRDRSSADEMSQRLTEADLTSVEVIDDDTETTREAGPAELDAGGDAIASEVALARTALNYLVTTDPKAAEKLPRAIRLVGEPADTREPVTMLLVGGLVIAVLQTEVKWDRAENGRWKLRVHKRAMRDSTIATLVRSVLRLGGGSTGQTQ
jgi:hypothetical protein